MSVIVVMDGDGCGYYEIMYAFESTPELSAALEEYSSLCIRAATKNEELRKVFYEEQPLPKGPAWSPQVAEADWGEYMDEQEKYLLDNGGGRPPKVFDYLAKVGIVPVETEVEMLDGYYWEV
jgi:hypothetical protein